MNNITIVVTAFVGRNLLVGNTIEDAGALLLYTTGVHTVVADNTMRREERGASGWTFHGSIQTTQLVVSWLPTHVLQRIH